MPILSRTLRLSPAFSELLEDAKWKISISNDHSFITSDTAFSAVRTAYFHNKKLCEDRCYVFPLSSKICLHVSGKGDDLVFEEVNKSEVDEINEAIACGADKWILGCDHELINGYIDVARMHKNAAAKTEILNKIFRTLSS